jgi:hypothetical protein
VGLSHTGSEQTSLIGFTTDKAEVRARILGSRDGATHPTRTSGQGLWTHRMVSNGPGPCAAAGLGVTLRGFRARCRRRPCTRTWAGGRHRQRGCGRWGKKGRWGSRDGRGGGARGRHRPCARTRAAGRRGQGECGSAPPDPPCAVRLRPHCAWWRRCAARVLRGSSKVVIRVNARQSSIHGSVDPGPSSATVDSYLASVWWWMRKAIHSNVVRPSSRSQSDSLSAVGSRGMCRLSRGGSGGIILMARSRISSCTRPLGLPPSIWDLRLKTAVRTGSRVPTRICPRMCACSQEHWGRVQTSLI